MRLSHIMLTVLFILLIPITAKAHKLGVYAWQQDNQIIAEGYFVDGSPCTPCNIEVYDAASGSLIANAPTSTEGIITFDSSANSLRLILTAPGGHRVEETIELSAATEGSQTPLSTKGTQTQPSESNARDEHKKESQPPLKSILLGLAIIAAMAGLWAMTRKR